MFELQAQKIRVTRYAILGLTGPDAQVNCPFPSTDRGSDELAFKEEHGNLAYSRDALMESKTGALK